MNKKTAAIRSENIKRAQDAADRLDLLGEALTAHYDRLLGILNDPADADLTMFALLCAQRCEQLADEIHAALDGGK